MTTNKLAKRLVRLVRERAQNRCEYCQASEWLSGQLCQVDHIIPRIKGGASTEDNLCLACVACNGYKTDQVEAVDPETGQVVVLYNPRRQSWSENFTWSADGAQIIGLTAVGRATVVALRLNRPLAVAARHVWVSVNRHPPGN